MTKYTSPKLPLPNWARQIKLVGDIFSIERDVSINDFCWVGDILVPFLFASFKLEIFFLFLMGEIAFILVFSSDIVFVGLNLLFFLIIWCLVLKMRFSVVWINLELLFFLFSWSAKPIFTLLFKLILLLLFCFSFGIFIFFDILESMIILSSVLFILKLFLSSISKGLKILLVFFWQNLDFFDDRLLYWLLPLISQFPLSTNLL